ncbi:hypothetical protein QQ008_26295 [Fulvivirgaceae bacterium BMA10]|uniref:Uncharacterized protein n=1 Tax=Splendidivirga corallicola TaxID=3051826 RepID=A0ABT8KWZ7_9BACT|nr:hypothetical protein [Fulvivirgaceae bacterium BMA10]
MGLSTLGTSKIKEILIHEGKDELGFKMIIALNNGGILYFNSLWLHFINVENFVNKYKFKKSNIEADYIETVYCFEGVGFYIIISTGYIIHIYEEIFDFEKPKYRHTFDIIYSNDKKRYDKLLNDIMEMGEPDKIIEGPPKFW